VRDAKKRRAVFVHDARDSEVTDHGFSLWAILSRRGAIKRQCMEKKELSRFQLLINSGSAANLATISISDSQFSKRP
jgi:hypothetical protein